MEGVVLALNLRFQLGKAGSDARMRRRDNGAVHSREQQQDEARDGELNRLEINQPELPRAAGDKQQTHGEQQRKRHD
jgi:hypothetical protein